LISEVEKRVFREDKTGNVFIGLEKIEDQLRGSLRDEANYFLKSRLWEVLSATIINESVDMALKKSGNWDHVLSAKQLYYWHQTMDKIITKLAQ
jgi:hypothetical protein